MLFLDHDTSSDPAGSSARDPFRSSDHDPVLVGLEATRGNGLR